MAGRDWDLEYMVKSSTYREHMTGRSTLLMIPLMAMANRVTERTDVCGMPFICVCVEVTGCYPAGLEIAY
jgi:hypothetical protein